MSMTTLDQLATIPALLVTLVALLLLRDDDARKGTRRLLVSLPALGLLLTAAILLVAPQPGAPFNPLSFNLPQLLAPSLAGLIALILLNLNALQRLSGRARLLALALLLLFVALSAAGAFNERLALLYLTLPAAILLVLGWIMGRRNNRLSVLFAFLVLALVLFINYITQNPPGSRITPPGMILQFLFSMAIIGAPALLVAIAAALIAGALEKPGPRFSKALRLLLPALLLGILAYLLYWWSVWDNTVDMGFGAFAREFIGPVAVGAGMVLALQKRAAAQTTGQARQAALQDEMPAPHLALAGLLFLVLAPLFFYQVHDLGMRQSHHTITEDRAVRIAAALESYHVRQGRYPPSLQSLVPRDLLVIPGPIILAGEDWCYRGDEDAYQLAAFYREFFSSPVSLRLYASAGAPPWDNLPCDERVADMEERYYSPMNDPQAAQPPVPTPLPTVEVPGGKTVVEPVLEGTPVSPGSWSLDGATYVFGAQTAILTLHFLDARSGDICPTEGQVAYAPTLRQRHAWLPDGRLLYLDTNGEMLAFTPCQPQAENLTERFSATFTLMPAVSGDGRRILLQSEDAYWVLDGETLTAQRIEAITPNPYDLHWDTFAWLPSDGPSPLAIAQLNGRDGSEGSTLHLVDGDSGNVLRSLPLSSGNNQSPGFIEGLPGERVLMHGDGQWLMFDFSTDPPSTTSIMPDIFGLDVHYPNDVSAAGAYVQEDGHNFYLVVRLNLARNTATYLYDSATGDVHIFDHEFHTLLLFPNGELVQMTNLEQVQEMHDTYDLLRVADPDAAPQRLVFEGHAPRDNPYLSINYLSQTDQIAVSSAHGVSLISLTGAEREIFYDLSGPGFSPWLSVSPGGSAFVASKDQGGLYGPLP